jgi:hypothetical protein
MSTSLKTPAKPRPRFLANAETRFNDLAMQPKMDAPLSLRRPELAGLRKSSVVR